MTTIPPSFATSIASGQPALIVNFLGGPGSGKTYLSHEVLPLLKKAGHRAYLVPDFAAMHVFEGNTHAIHDHFSRTAETNRCIEQAEMAGHTIILVENPVLMSFAYMDDSVVYRNELLALVNTIHRQRPSLNLLMHREESFDYDAQSRHLTQNEAHQVDDRVQRLVQEQGMACVPVTGLAPFDPQDDLAQARAVALAIDQMVHRLALTHEIERLDATRGVTPRPRRPI